MQSYVGIRDIPIHLFEKVFSLAIEIGNYDYFWPKKRSLSSEFDRNQNKVHFSILCNDQGIKPLSKIESLKVFQVWLTKSGSYWIPWAFLFLLTPWSRDSLEGMIYIPQCLIGSCFFTIWPHFWGNSSIEFFLI